MDWIDDSEDEEYDFRTSIYEAILNQYTSYCQHVVLNVGGLYKNEIKVGDDFPKYQNIPAAKQKASLEYMFTLWDDLDWISDKKVLGTLPIIGSPEYAVRELVQNLILLTPSFCSLSDGVATEELSFKECADIIFNHIWKSTKSGRKLTDAEKQFQKAFVKHFMTTGNFKMPGAGMEAFADIRDYVSITAASGNPALSFAGEIMYSPVSGYEWFPRTIFNQGDMSQMDCYVYLSKALDLMKSKLSTLPSSDRIHYQLLIRNIEYGLK